MAFLSGSASVVWCNGYDLSSYFKKASAPGMADVYDTTTFGKTSKTKIPGLKDSSLALEGLFEGTADAVDQVLAAALGAATNSLWSLGIGAGSLGTRSRHMAAVTAKYDVQAPVDGVVTATAEAQSSTGPEPGIILKAKTEDPAGTTNGTSVDNAAATTNGATAILHAFATGGGFTTGTVKVQDSADDSSWADIITFTAVTVAPASERIEITGTVRRYTRVVDDATGGTFTIGVTFARG